MYVSKGVIVGEVASAITTGELSERERAILDFERHWLKRSPLRNSLTSTLLATTNCSTR